MQKLDFEKIKVLDELSQKKVPFFFMIDFLMENILVFSKEDLDQKRIWVDFPSYKNVESNYTITKRLYWLPKPASQKEYQKGYDVVQRYLKRGDSYLVNYTCETPVETNYSLEEIFIVSDAKYKMLLPNDFAFFSPETFVETNCQKIFTHPMKGTIDASLPDAIEQLKNSEKEKAEHYTVVDLLRNDLSIVADCVRLDEFQRIDYLRTSYKNLYTMSSEISGILKPEFVGKVGSLMNALLPAGSILGAPKTKTLNIILEAEKYARGFYTGVAGYFDGENLDSCVMIRFMEENDGKLNFKSGGGITHLSKLADEYQEMKNKIYVPIYRKY